MRRFHNAAPASAADFLASGNFDHDLRSIARTGDEIGVLASSFMATQLKERGAVEARLAALVLSSTETIMAVSLDSALTAGNTAADAMFGYTADEMVGPPLNLIP